MNELLEITLWAWIVIETIIVFTAGSFELFPFIPRICFYFINKKLKWKWLCYISFFHWEYYRVPYKVKIGNDRDEIINATHRKCKICGREERNWFKNSINLYGWKTIRS